MRYAKLKTAIIQDLHVLPLDIEVSLLKGLPKFEVSGLASRKGQEIFGRVKAALQNNGYQIPKSMIICHVSKELSLIQDNILDLAIALAILMADQQIKVSEDFEPLIIGGLSLSGAVTKVKGVYACLKKIKTAKYWILPKENESELIYESNPSLESIYLVKDINQAVDVLSNKNRRLYSGQVKSEILDEEKSTITIPNIFDSLNQMAIEIALMGWHPLLIINSPNINMAYLFEYATYLTPKLRNQDYEGIRSIYSIKGIWDEVLSKSELKTSACPDFDINKSDLIGDNKNLMPGLVSMLNHGQLFLENLNLYKTDTLRLLRKPIQDKRVEVGTSKKKQIYPTNFLLIASMLPCPCGYSFEGESYCVCKHHEIETHKKKVLSSIYDLFHLTTILKAIKNKQDNEDTSFTMLDNDEIKLSKEKIEKARLHQKKRLDSLDISFMHNADIPLTNLAEYCRISDKVLRSFDNQIKGKIFFANSFYNLIRLSRTLADLKLDEDVQLHHLEEAFVFGLKPGIY